ncbi:pimeloyl-ACP methyl ester carboxylesterase [Labedaea rhizosphaerae]|uniref:Pimeloyl-ACP methyl ester carboxylesterase n=2 Tax=Labedaea rhizosphaerae TaxID=598644 RepID=A0A4R6RX80_LABRH|nr:pimeloyl-ACP methyl ester carboxylesterase [Labedaea rhizosphaerae]
MVAPLGVPTVAVELPSCGTSAPLGDLAADVRAVRAVLDADPGEPTVLVGHSYGGVVITAAGEHPSVTRLVYVSSMLPDAGESLAGLAGPGPGWVQPDADGLLAMRPDLTEDQIRHHFLADCAPEFAAAAIERLARQNPLALTQPAPSAAWRTVPSRYVVCSEDRATPPQRQRWFAERAAEVVELACGHHPFLSRPGDLADAILAP